MGWTLGVLVAVGLLATDGAFAQAVPSGAGVVLQQMASQAGVIFAGQVIEVSRNDASGFVDVRFHIDDAVRGCPKTGFYVLREWAGLWTGHADRYVKGQRLLMLLTARSTAGMSAPLGGMDGAIPLVATGTEPLAHGTGVAPGEDGSSPAAFAADLRWIEARAARSTGSTANRLQAQVQGPAQGQPVAIGPALPFSGDSSESWAGPIGALNPAIKGVSTAGVATLSAVMALLRSANGAAGDARY